MSSDIHGAARLAVLIDAENIGASRVGSLFEEVAKLGRATVKRIYGDWTRPDMAQWRDVLHQRGITPIQQFRLSKGKNSVDCALIVDAMDLLYTGRFDGFCIVSSDSDFTRLVHRLRESGQVVHGFGAATAPEGFVKACDRFILLESPGPEPEPKPAAVPAASANGAALKLDEAHRQLVKAAYDAAMERNGWVEMASFGNWIRKLSPSFKPGDFGCAKLGRFVELSGLFDVMKVSNGKEADLTIWRIRWRIEPEPMLASPAETLEPLPASPPD